MWIRFRPWWNKKINDQWWGIKLLVTYHPVNGYQFHSSDLDGCLLLCYWLSLMDFFYFIDIFFLFFLSLSVSPLSLANLSGFDPFNLFDWIVLLIGALLNRQTATNWMIGVRYLVPFIVDVEAHRLLAGRGKSCHRSVGSLRHYHKMTKRDWNVKKKPRTETVSHTNHFEPLKTRLTVGWRIEVSSSSSRRSSRISEEDEGRREGGREGEEKESRWNEADEWVKPVRNEKEPQKKPAVKWLEEVERTWPIQKNLCTKTRAMVVWAKLKQYPFGWVAEPLSIFHCVLFRIWLIVGLWLWQMFAWWTKTLLLLLLSSYRPSHYHRSHCDVPIHQNPTWQPIYLTTTQMVSFIQLLNVLVIYYPPDRCRYRSIPSRISAERNVSYQSQQYSPILTASR